MKLVSDMVTRERTSLVQQLVQVTGEKSVYTTCCAVCSVQCAAADLNRGVKWPYRGQVRASAMSIDHLYEKWRSNGWHRTGSIYLSSSLRPCCHPCVCHWLIVCVASDICAIERYRTGMDRALLFPHDRSDHSADRPWSQLLQWMCALPLPCPLQPTLSEFSQFTELPMASMA